MCIGGSCILADTGCRKLATGAFCLWPLILRHEDEEAFLFKEDIPKEFDTNNNSRTEGEMKHCVASTLMDLFLVTFATAQVYPTVSIHDLQFVSSDSLLKCDTIGINAGLAGWTKQSSLYYLSHTGNVRDTVEIVGMVIVPPKIITFTGPGTPFPGPTWNGAGGYNIVLRDTSADSTYWSSIFVRPALASDTVQLYDFGYLALNAGDIIRLRGYVDEFPANNMSSYTEFVPVTQTFIPTVTMPDGPLELLGHKNTPLPLTANPGMFMKGTYGSGAVMFSTGEPLEECYVQMTNLTVSAIVNYATGTFAVQDSLGNEISILDGSTWFTQRGYRNAASTYTLPSIGQAFDTIRGFILSNSGSEAARGYRIVPCFPSDLVKSAPLAVELASMKGEAINQSAALTWTTATETNNSRFEIERRRVTIGSTEWETIGAVMGSGSSSAPHRYSFLDKNLAPGQYAYRLKQIDRDGTFKYCGNAEVTIGIPTIFSLEQNYPNPANPSTNIPFSLPQQSRVRLAIFDLLGREVATLVNEERNAGSYSVTWNASSFASGVYFYRLQAGEFVQTTKLVLLK
jgi:hypothetical protein